MYRTNNRERAIELASSKGLEFGHSVFDGRFYVGNLEELVKIGVILDEESPRNLAKERNPFDS